MAKKPRGKRRVDAAPAPPVTEPVVPERSITLPDPPPMEPEFVAVPDPPPEESDDDPPTDPGKATFTADQIGSSALPSAGTVETSTHLTFTGYDYLVPVPVDQDDGEDDGIDEIRGLLPGPTLDDDQVPTAVEPVEETEETPIIPPPTQPQGKHTTLYNDLAGPSGPAPKEINMTSPNPSSPVPPKPEDNSRLVPALLALAGIAGVAVVLLVVGLHRPTADHDIQQVTTAEVRAAEPPPVPAEIVALSKPTAPDEPGDDADALDQESVTGPILPVAPEPTKASAVDRVNPNPTTGYEADEPPIATVAKPAATVAAPVAKPIPVAATVPAPKSAAPPAAVAKPVVAAKVVAAAAPPAPQKAKLPDSLVVSSMGPKPACKAECAWGNVSPTTGLPMVANGTHAVTCGDVTYAVTTLAKIADGPQKYCYTVTGVSAN